MGWFNKYLVGFSEAYPEINAIVKSNEYVLSGRLRTIDEAGEEWGNYDVEIVFSSQYPKVLPKLYERSNKLGKTVNNHFFLDDGSCCYGWNTEVHLYLKSDFSFKNLIDTAIMPFFLQQDFKRATNGEFYREYKRHDKLDAIIFYQDYFDVPYFKMALDAMQQVIKGRAPNNYCFCGKKVNGLSIKNVSCTAHTQKVKELIKHCGKEMIKADFEMIVEELKKKNMI